MNKEAELQKENTELREAWLKLADRVVELEAELAAMRGAAPVLEVVHGPLGSDGAPEWVKVVTLGEFDIEHLPNGMQLYAAPLPAPSQVAAEVVQVPRDEWQIGLPESGTIAEARIAHHTTEGVQVLWTEVEVIAHALINGVPYSWVKETGADGGFYAPMMLTFRALLATSQGKA